MGEGLSGRQAAILGFIHRHCTEQGYPPTVREIGCAVGLASPSTVHAHLAKLVEAGHLRRDPTKPRTVLLTQAAPGDGEAPAGGPRADSLPLVGAVAAGLPRLAHEDVEDWIRTPFRADYLLRVSGDSMTDAGILDGDLVAVRRGPSADDGQIVVARLEDEATVKRLRRRDGRVWLVPENAAYEPIAGDEAELLGVVVGVMRRL